jgi:hypothetical protein
VPIVCQQISRARPKFYRSIDGKWVEPSPSATTFDVIDPATEELTGKLAMGTEADADRPSRRHAPRSRPGPIQAHRFFNSDFVERVHRRLHARQIDARAVRFDAHFHVRVHNTLYCNHYL